MKKLLILFLTIGLLTACNDNNPRGFNNKDSDGGWTNKLRNKYLNECIDAAGDNAKLAKKVCSCVLEKVEKKYTVEEAEELSEAVGARMAKECMEDVGGNNNKDDENGYTKKRDDDEYDQGASWSKKDRNQWMDVCATAMNNDPRTEDICSCVLGKLQKKYSSLSEADRKGGEEAGKKLTQECLGMDEGGDTDDYNDN
jgi:hypothetical protein